MSYHPRIGVSKISGTVRGTIGAAWCILTRIVVNLSLIHISEPTRPY